MPIVTRHCRQRRHEVHLSHQVDYLADDSGRIIVDFVGRFEQLSNDMAKIVDRLGLAKAELPHLNKSPRSPCILGAGDARDQSRPSLDGVGVTAGPAATLVRMVTRFFLSMLTICGVQFIESARNFV